MARGKTDENKPNLFWFASTSGERGREQTLKVLRKNAKGLTHDVNVFEVPTDIRYGSFDDVIRLLDDIAKQETSLESILRRIQRQALDLNPDSEFSVNWLRQKVTVDEYIRRFQWDEARYPKNRNAREILDTIVQQASRLDDDIKQKLLSYNETKTSHASLDSKVDASLIQRDLVDVFGELADPSVLINTENLCSIPVVVPKLQKSIFLNSYSDPKICRGVAPESAHLHTKATDRDGNMLFTVVVMNRNKEEFITAMRKIKCTAKEYTHEAGGFDTRKQKRAALDAEKSRQEQYLTRVCVAAFGDIIMAVIHLKALKIFVDSVLRLGVPVNFVAYSFMPLSGTKQQSKLWDDMIKAMAPENHFEAKDDTYLPFAFAELRPYA